MADHVKKVEISQENYEQMLRQVKGYTSGNVQTAATIQDQPPPQGKSVPAWVREAEALAAQSQPMLEEDSMGTEAEV